MTTAETEILASKLDTIASLLARPAVPLEKQVWSPAQCAEYLQVTERKFRYYIANSSTFPKPTRINEKNSSLTDARWFAGDVINWFKANRDR